MKKLCNLGPDLDFWIALEKFKRLMQDIINVLIKGSFLMGRNYLAMVISIELTVLLLEEITHSRESMESLIILIPYLIYPVWIKSNRQYITDLLSCQSRVTVTCFVYKVITDLESIDHLCIDPILWIGSICK